MKKQLFKISFVIISLIAFVYAMAQDAPLGYTTWFKLRYWDEDAHPSADSVNQNLKDIDTHLHNRDVRIDSAKSAISWMFNYPAGTWKRYSSAEFDDDTLKVKSGVFPKLADNNSFSGTNTFTSGEVKFDQTGSAGSTLNFIYSDGAGGVFINKNTFTSLLKFDEGDGNYWQFGYPITVAGDVDITGTFKKNGAGLYLFDSLKTSHNITGDTVKANYIKADLEGGNITKGTLPDARLSSNIPRLDTRQTYTKRNVYSDTLKADGLSQMEQVKIADWVNISGDVTSDLNFAKGSTTRIGTIDANSLQIIKQDTAYITLDNSGISIARNIVPADTKGLFWSTSSVASSSGILAYKSSNHNFATRYSNNVMTLDSGNGMLMYANKFMFMDTVNSWIKNYNPYAMYLGTNSDTAMKIDSLNSVRFFENISIDGNLDVSGTIGGVDFNGTGDVTAVNISSSAAIIDDGSQISLLNGSNVASGTVAMGRLDSAKIPRKDSLYTNNNRSVNNFWNLLYVYGVALFSTAPTVSSFFQDVARTKQYWLPNSASDSIVALNQTQELKNKTINAANNTISIKRSIMHFTAATLAAPADASSYYFGSPDSQIPDVGGALYDRIYFPVACTIKACTFNCYKGGAASNENVTIVIRNGTTATDYTITSTGQFTTAAGNDTYTNSSMNVVINAGDYILFRVDTPTWATNPTNARFTATVSIE